MNPYVKHRQEYITQALSKKEACFGSIHLFLDGSSSNKNSHSLSASNANSILKRIRKTALILRDSNAQIDRLWLQAAVFLLYLCFLSLLSSATQGKLYLINQPNGFRKWFVSAMLPLVKENIYIPLLLGFLARKGNQRAGTGNRRRCMCVCVGVSTAFFSWPRGENPLQSQGRPVGSWRGGGRERLSCWPFFSLGRLGRLRLKDLPQLFF